MAKHKKSRKLHKEIRKIRREERKRHGLCYSNRATIESLEVFLDALEFLA
jgi:hypothetical protein